MTKRIDLHNRLVSLLGGTQPEKRVYFQPGPSMSLSYPCIVYNRDDILTKKADNQVYGLVVGYQVTVIDRDPDSPIVERVASMEHCSYSRSFRADQLNHDIFVVYQNSKE